MKQKDSFYLAKLIDNNASACGQENKLKLDLAVWDGNGCGLHSKAASEEEEHEVNMSGDD